MFNAITIYFPYPSYIPAGWSLIDGLHVIKREGGKESVLRGMAQPSYVAATNTPWRLPIPLEHQPPPVGDNATPYFGDTRKPVAM